jgi:WD40 repeat protein
MNADFLISSSDDWTISLWDLRTNASKFNLTGHTDIVRGLKLVSFDVLASGSIDSTIKMWNLTNGKLIKTLRNHTAKISWSVDLLNSQTLVSGSADQTVNLWNFNTDERLNTVNTNLQIRCLTVLNSILTTTTTSKL